MQSGRLTSVWFAVLLSFAIAPARAADPAACFAADVGQAQRYEACGATANDAALPAGVRANAFVALADMEAKRDRQGEAIKAFDAAIILNGKDSATFLARAKLLETMGQDEKAAADYTTVLSLDPASAEAFARRGALRLKSDKPAVLAGALADLANARRLNSSDPAIVHRLATAQLRTNHNAEAVVTFSTILATTPDEAAARRGRATAYGRLGNFDAAIADLNYLLKLKPDDAETLIARGVASVQAGRFDAAVTDFTLVLLARPDDTEVLFFRGTARFRAGDLRGSEADFTAVLTKLPSDPDALAGRALARVTLGRLAEAENDLSAALQRAPRAGALLGGRGRLRVLRGDYAGAAKDLAAAMATPQASAELAVWRFIAERHAGGDGKTGLATARRVFSDKDWMMTAVRYFLGEVGADDVIASAGDAPLRICDASYFLGQGALLRGDADAAKSHFTAATIPVARGSFSYIGARIALAQLARP